MKFPTYEEMAKNVAEKALDEFIYQGRRAIRNESRGNKRG